MYEDIPNWLKPFLKPEAYKPTKEFVKDLVPQSRVEALLKYFIIQLTEKFDGFFDSDGKKFVTSDGLDFMVVSQT